MTTIEAAKAALASVRALRKSRKIAGVDGICDHVKDVEGDWLENWFIEGDNNDY